MIQVKLIKQQFANMERDINEALKQIGGEPGYKVKLEDIKLMEFGGPGMLTAMIIYNKTVATDQRPTRG